MTFDILVPAADRLVLGVRLNSYYFELSVDENV